jgi:hypothetical protein
MLTLFSGSRNYSPVPSLVKQLRVDLSESPEKPLALSSRLLSIHLDPPIADGHRLMVYPSNAHPNPPRLFNFLHLITRYLIIPVSTQTGLLKHLPRQIFEISERL